LPSGYIIGKQKANVKWSPQILPVFTEYGIEQKKVKKNCGLLSFTAVQFIELVFADVCGCLLVSKKLS
jgi:hypothetical protein